MRLILLILLGLAFVALAYLFGGVVPIYALPGYCLAAFAGILGFFLIRRVKIPPSQTCIIFALVFGGYLMARGLLSPVPFLAMGDILSIEAALIVYILTAFQLIDTRQRLALLCVLCGLLIVQMIVGVVQFTRGDEYMIQGGVRPAYGIRASGFYICPNHLAGFAEIVTLLCFAVVIWGRMGYGRKIIFGYFGCVGLLAVVLTGSRGGYLSTAAGGIALIALSAWLLIRSAQGLSRFVLVASIITVLSGAGVYYVFSKSEKLKERAVNIADLGNMRTLLWASAWKQHKECPIFGTGAGTFSYYGRKFRDPRVQYDPVHVHNDYIHLLAEYGWLGVGFFLVCLLAHLMHGIRAVEWVVENRLIRSSRGQSTALALLAGSLAALVALAVHSVVDFNMHIPVNAMLVAWLFGILANPGVEMGARLSRREPVFILTQTFAALLGAFLLFQLLPGAKREYYGEQLRLAWDGNDDYEVLKLAKQATPTSNAMTWYAIGEARRRIALELPLPKMQASFLSAAVEAYRQGLVHYPYDSYMLIRLGQCLDLLGKYKESAEVFAEAGRWDPNLGRYHAMLGQHFELQGKTADAKREYERARELKGGLQMVEWGLSRLEKINETPPLQPTPSPSPP